MSRLKESTLRKTRFDQKAYLGGELFLLIGCYKSFMVNIPELVGVPGVAGCSGMAAVVLGDELSPVPTARHEHTRLEQQRLGCVLMLVLMVLPVSQPNFRKKRC